MTVALVDSTKFPARLVGNGVSTIFVFQYKILTKSDLLVYIAGILKTVDADYTVAGFNADAGGTVTFAVAPINGASVIIMRSVQRKRVTDYQQHGDFLSSTVNPDFDNAVLLIQDLAEQVSRSLQSSLLDPLTSVTIDKTSFAGQFISVNGSGQLVPSSGTGNDTALRADLANTTTAGKGNELISFRKTAAETAASVTPVNFYYPELNVKRYGAVADGDSQAVTGTDNLAAFNLAIAVARKIAGVTGRVYIPGGSYGVTGSVICPSGVKLVGDGPFSVIIFPLVAFNAPIVQTTESGTGQPPGGLFDITVAGTLAFTTNNVPLVKLGANASSCVNCWIGANGYTALECASTNQIVSRVVIDGAIAGSGAANGIVITAPGVQVDTCNVYQQNNSYYIHDIPIVIGLAPTQIQNCQAINPLSGSFGLLIINTNSMPVDVIGFTAMSTATTDFSNNVVHLMNAPNVRVFDSHVDFKTTATGTQIGFYADSTSNFVEFNNCSTKGAYSGVFIFSTSGKVNGGSHQSPVSVGVGLAGASANIEVSNVSVYGGGTAFKQDDGGNKNVFQGNQAIGSTLGYSVTQNVATSTWLKSNHSSCTTDYTISGTQKNCGFIGNTNNTGAVESPVNSIVVGAATYTVGIAERKIIANFAGVVTLTLPPVANTGRELSIRTITANTVVSAAANVVPVAGGAAATAILAATAGKYALLYSDGTNYQTEAAN